MNEFAAKLSNFYAHYDAEGRYEDRYGYANPVAAAYWSLRDELVRASVIRKFEVPHGHIEVLEIGVGLGHELAKLSLLGIPHHKLTGVDLVTDRLSRARTLYPGINFVKQDAAHLDFPAERFDIVCQFTCVMHADSKAAQIAICSEMIRVLKPGGLVLWWDVAPLHWNTLLMQRFCNILLSDIPVRSLLSGTLQSFREMFSPSVRRKALYHAEADAPHVLPISPTEIASAFAGHKVDVKRAGMDFTVWQQLFRLSPSLASALWRGSWFSRHCFAVIEKV
jgi:SAM-dependent methyltransferase